MNSQSGVMVRVAMLAAAAIALLLRPVKAQELQFHAGVDLVAVHVAVTDKDGHFVKDLRADDFSIFEDGKPQDAVLFEKSSVPLTAMLLLDTSDSMAPCLQFAQEAAVGFVRGLRPEDRMAVLPFESRLHAVQGLTADVPLLEKTIRETHAGGTTALYDTLYIALKEMRSAAQDGPAHGPRRQAILLLTDGADSASLTTFDDVLDLAVHSDAVIYPIALPGAATPELKPESPAFVLGRLAEQTGGRTFYPSDPGQLGAVYQRIKGELDNEYLFGYRSARHDGLFHQIAVRVGRHGVSARTRPGYFADRR